MYEIENNIPIPKRTMSEEHKLKIGNIHRGKIISDKTRRKIGEANRRRIVSKGTKKKMSESHKDIKFSEERKKRMLGRKHSETAKLKMSKSHKGKILSKETRLKMSKLSKMRLGNKNHNWKGGISSEPYSFDFNEQLKSEIKKRDNHQCQNDDCRKITKTLSIHHIDYDKKNSSKENLITLCLSCNSKANKNRKYWTKFYHNLLLNKHTKKPTCKLRID